MRRTRLQQCAIELRAATTELLAQRQRSDLPPEVRYSIERMIHACDAYTHAQADVFNEALDSVGLKVARLEAALELLSEPEP